MKGNDFFSHAGAGIKEVLAEMGEPTSIDAVPLESDLTQYRFDYVDSDFVVFLFEKAGRISRVNLVKKSEWSGWAGHKQA